MSVLVEEKVELSGPIPNRQDLIVDWLHTGPIPYSAEFIIPWLHTGPIPYHREFVSAAACPHWGHETWRFGWHFPHPPAESPLCEVHR